MTPHRGPAPRDCVGPGREPDSSDRHGRTYGADRDFAGALGVEPGSRQSRDSSRLSDDPTSWSGTTRLRWSRPGARFKRQAWSDIWCRPRLCRGPEVWGTRTYDESAMFEALTLGVFEVGLSWSIVFGKRDAFRKAFRGFDVAKVAAMTELAKSYAITRK